MYLLNLQYYKTKNSKISSMNSDQIIVCQKHKKKQKNLGQIPSNYYICLNRYCPNSYSVLCSTCKNEHRDHQIKVLSIEDISFLIQRLVKLPFRQVGTFIAQSVEILKKFKLVSQFTRKINSILAQLQHQTLDFINITETIISQYAQCKSSTQKLSEVMTDFESKQTFDQFKKNTIQKLNKIDYNTQKDRLEYGSLQIKEKEDVRKKNLSFLRRKIEQIKEYSMKIIQVILNNDESDEQQQDIAHKKKLYQNFKNEISQAIKAEEQSNSVKKSKVKQIKQVKQVKQVKPVCKQMSIDTDNKWIEQLQKNNKQLKSQLQAANLYLKKAEIQNKNKINAAEKEKQNIFRQKQLLKKEKEKIQKLFDQKCQFFNHYQKRLRDNFQKRKNRYKQRQQLIKQLSQLVEHQRVTPRGNSAQKQNRQSSRQKIV